VLVVCRRCSSLMITSLECIHSSGLLLSTDVILIVLVGQPLALLLQPGLLVSLPVPTLGRQLYAQPLA
jgi:hypothetical protein